jgi:hypothetical protein
VKNADVKNVLALLAVLAVSTSCSRVQTRTLAHPNPTSQRFPFPAQEVHDQAIGIFSLEHQVRNPVFGPQPFSFSSTLFLESSTNAVFAESIFRDSTNAQDLYLHTFHDPFVRSPVYVGSDGNLPFIAAFHLHLNAVASNETEVSVAALETEVISGQHFGIGPCGPGMANTYRPVKPTTVEEYTILRYLGNYLGVTNMPAVILPAEN